MKKYLVIFLLITCICSCSPKICLMSNFNAIGKIIKSKKVSNYEGGNCKLLIRIDPKTKVWAISNKEFNKGDSVVFVNEMNILLYEP